MFQTGAFNPIPMGFQYPGQQPPASIYHSQYGGFNPQIPTPFQQVLPSREHSLPATMRQYPPPTGPYPPTQSRRHGQCPPPTSSQHHEHCSHGSKNKKHPKRRSVSPSGEAEQGLYSDKEKNNRKSSEDRSRSPSIILGSRSKQEEANTNNQEQRSPTVENTSGDASQGGTNGTDEQQDSVEKEKRKSRSKKKTHHRYDYYKNQFQQQPAYYGELPAHMRVHQQPLYSGYKQVYEESIRRGDIHQKQGKGSTRVPPETKQQLSPHENDQKPQSQQQFPYSGYPQQPFAGIHQPQFNPYQPYAPQPGFFGPTTPYNARQPWPNVGGLNGSAGQEIQRLRKHIHTLEGELHKLQKKLNKTTLNNHEPSAQDENNRKHLRSKHDDIGSPRQTPVIVELNSTIGESVRESTSKKDRHRTGSHVSSQQGQNLVQQQSGGISGENTTDQETISSVNNAHNQSSNQQQIDSRDRSRSGGNQISEVEDKPSSSSSSSKNPREETAAAHVNAHQQVPPPPPVQQQYVYQQGALPSQGQQIRGPAPRFPVAGNIHYPNDPYQQQQQQRNILNSNYNQSNNNELFDNDEERRNRSAEKILDAFERFYINSGKSTTVPMKVKYIPEEHNSNHNHQRNTNNNNNNRYRSTSRSNSQSSSSSTWSNSDRLSSRNFYQKNAASVKPQFVFTYKVIQATVRPQTKIYVVPYVDFISVGNKISNEASCHRVTDVLTNTLKEAAEKVNVGFIESVKTAFVGHEIFLADPYVDSLFASSNVAHPNAKGYAKISPLVVAHLASVQ